MAKSLKYRIYICSDYLVSNELPDEIKDLCVREPATYRVTKPEKAMTAKERRESREVVRSKKTVTARNMESQEEVELEIEFAQFDKSLWRYYFECAEIKDLLSFAEELYEYGLPYRIQPIEDESIKSYSDFIEVNFGLEPLPERSYILSLSDEGMFDDEEMEPTEDNG